MAEQRFHDLTIAPNRLGTSSHGRANNALKKLSALINFASDRFGTDDEPLIKLNPVTRLSRNRAWHRIHPRQRIILDDKLKDWYRACCSLKYSVGRDFLVFLLFSGMRFGETRRLKWSYIDFKGKLLTVPREVTKSDRELELPLSNFLVDLLNKRRLMQSNSEWVFQSTKSTNQHISQGIGIIREVRRRSGIYFTVHDLRRTFLTMGEKLEVPTYVLKKLVNHNVSNDMTGRYLVLDTNRNRDYMSKISKAYRIVRHQR
ncbi:MAG: tyrosine-type recombinase/integrase [Candidatus Melainabacteria bacterium]|nr:MAG: tyrosine-type recombinase/integrase [Candidatus Melainabacteria bacterium]